MACYLGWVWLIGPCNSDRCMKSSIQSVESSKPELFQEKNIEHSPGRRVELAIKHTDSFAAFLDLMDICLKDFAHAAISCLRSLRLPLSTSICLFLFLFRPESVPGIRLAFERRCCYEEGIYTDIDHPRRTPCEKCIYR
jgi:hypothetical protein